MDENIRRAVLALSQATGGRFDLWALTGPSNAAARASIMAALLGVPKVPKSKAGVCALEREFYQRCRIDGDCLAHRRRAFVDYCEKVGCPPIRRAAVRTDDGRVHVLFGNGGQTVGFYMLPDTYRALPIGACATVDDYRKLGDVQPAPAAFVYPAAA